MTGPGTTDAENTDAYGQRRRIRTKLRRTLGAISSRLMWTFKKPLPADTQLLPMPSIDDRSLGDFAARSTWYLGRWTSPDERTSDDLSVPDYLDPSIDLHGAERPLAGGRPVHRLIWKVTPRTYLRALITPASVTIVDPNFAKGVEGDGYLHLAKRLGRTVPDGFAVEALAPSDSEWSTSKALALGTGPSAGEVVGDHDDWTYRIVCNSAIRDDELMERLRPTHICFGDPVFHFGPSAYSGQFRADLKKVAEKYDSVLVVPGYCAALIAASLPWARGRLLPLELEREGWHAPTMDSLHVRITGNVLTQQMVPLAISLARSIDIGGADGRKPDEKYFWSHSRAHQYSDDLMNTVFEAHPGFFRDTDYADYYADHCAQVDGLIGYGEERGCTFTTVTSSYIPALASRMPIAN